MEEARNLILTNSFNQCPLTQAARGIRRTVDVIKKIDTDNIYEENNLTALNKNSFWKKLNREETGEMRAVLGMLKVIQEDLEYNATYNDRGVE